MDEDDDDNDDDDDDKWDDKEIEILSMSEEKEMNHDTFQTS